MKFRHRVETININGLTEYSVQYYLTEELTIGSGSSCQIRLPFHAVAIRHARLSSNPDGSVTLHDLTDGKRVLKVNGRTIRSRALLAGDKVLLGEIRLEVFFDGTFWGFRETRKEVDESAPKSDIRRELRKLDLAKFFPRQTVLCVLSMLLIVLLFFAEPARGRYLKLWSSGPISNVHRVIGRSCESCHKIPFEPVRDAECLQCHNIAQHSALLPAALKKHPSFGRRCAECHREHQGGPAPVSADSAECVRCHANLGRIAPQSTLPAVLSFEKHPDFRASTVQFLSAEEREVIRGFLGDTAQDTTRLSFGHKRHLSDGLRGLPAGKQALRCSDCHLLAPNRQDMLPITYAGQCASCHPLTFDERLPEKQVPHGDAGAVYNFMYAEYSKLFLLAEQRNERMAAVRRLKPGATVIDEPDLQFTREAVETESRNAEREIFTRTGCKVCHEVAHNAAKPPGESWYSVLVPYMPVRWFPAARFSHGAHESMLCASCHPGAERSEQTADVLLPPVQTCKRCHTSEAEHDKKVGSPCISCHSFHDPLSLDDREKRSVSSLLLGR